MSDGRSGCPINLSIEVIVGIPHPEGSEPVLERLQAAYEVELAKVS